MRSDDTFKPQRQHTHRQTNLSVSLLPLDDAAPSPKTDNLARRAAFFLVGVSVENARVEPRPALLLRKHFKRSEC